MKLPDVNLLLYAADETAPTHDAARIWWEAALSQTETVALAWSVVLAFVRLSTNARVFSAPLEVAEAIGVVEGWLAQPCTTVVDPTARHLAVVRDLLGPLGTAGNLVVDAHLAALAVEHGGVVCSADSDFARFPGVRWENPLAAG